MNNSHSKTRKLVFYSLMVAYSLALHLLEQLIPNPLIAFFPGAKLGFSNIITMLCLLNFGFKDTFKIISARVILSSIFAGAATVLLYSIAGAYLSLFGMYIAIKISGFSKVGISVFGAIMHNIGQLLVASAMIENLTMMTYLPVMLGASLATGIFIGIVVNFTDPLFKKHSLRFNP